MWTWLSFTIRRDSLRNTLVCCIDHNVAFIDHYVSLKSTRLVTWPPSGFELVLLLVFLLLK